MSKGVFKRWSVSPPLWLPSLVLLLLTLPSIGRGDGFSAHGFKPDDTAWYSAISLQNWRDFADGHTGPPGLELVGPRGWVMTRLGFVFVENPYFNKPPLAFVVHGFSLWVLGPVPAAARLPSILAAALTVWLLTLTATRLIGRPGGVLTGLALTFTMEFARHTQAFSLDLWLALWSTAAAWAVVGAAKTPSFRGRVLWALLAGAFIGLSLLTKPLVGLIMLPIVVAWLVWEKPLGVRAVVGVLALMVFESLVVAVPWHAYHVLESGSAFTNQYFGKEIADRATGGISNLNKDAGNSLYYVALLGKAYWPWLVAAALGAWMIVRGIRQPLNHYVLGVRSLLRLGVIAALVWLVVLSAFPDKRPRYLLVAYPFMAMLAGGWIDWAANSGRYVWLNDVRKAFLAWCVPLAAMLGIVLAVADKGKPRDKHYDELLAWLDAQPGGVHSAMNHLYAGGFSGQRAAVLYLETGQWSILASSRSNTFHADWGIFLIYHVRDGLAPGPGEETVFQSGDITVTRLIDDTWQPRTVEDPGE